MSRGRWYTTEQIIEALEKTHGGVYLAADTLGCSYKTIHRRADEVKAVQDVIDKYSGRRTDLAILKLEQAINNGEPWALTLQIMKSKEGRSRGYVERQEVTGADGQPHKVEVEYINSPIKSSGLSSEPTRDKE